MSCLHGRNIADQLLSAWGAPAAALGSCTLPPTFRWPLLPMHRSSSGPLSASLKSLCRRAAALSQLSRPSPAAEEPSRRLLGSMRQHVGGRWERAVQSPRGVPSESPFGAAPSPRPAAAGPAGGGGRGGRRVTFAEDSWPAGGNELEQPLLSRFTGQASGGAPSPFASPDEAAAPFAALDMSIGSEQAGSSHASLAESGQDSSTADLMQPTEVEDAEGAELPAQLTEAELPMPDTTDLVQQQRQQQARPSWQADAATRSAPAAATPAHAPQEGREAILGRRSKLSAAGDGAHKGPWGAGAELLQHSFSTPLLSDSAPTEQGQPRDEESSGGAEAGGLEGVIVCADHPHPAGGWGPEVLGEARRRLLAGLKRYFAAKRGEGLLSAEGLRCLNHACDVAFDRTGNALASPVRPSALHTYGGCGCSHRFWPVHCCSNGEFLLTYTCCHLCDVGCVGGSGGRGGRGVGQPPRGLGVHRFETIERQAPSLAAALPAAASARCLWRCGGPSVALHAGCLRVRSRARYVAVLVARCALAARS